MAYRTFSQPVPARAAKFEGMPELIRSIDTNRILRAKKDQSERKAVAEKQKRIEAIKLDDYGDLLPHDIVEATKRGISLKNSFTNDLRETGGESAKTAKERDNLTTDVARMRRDAILKKEADNSINKREQGDPFYKADIDRDKVNDFYSKDYSDRSKDEADKVILNDHDTFDQEGEVLDYVSNLPENTFELENDDGKGNITTSTVSGAFINNKGNILVTPADAEKYLAHDDRVDDSVRSIIDWRIGDELLRMRKANLPEFKVTNDMNFTGPIKAVNNTINLNPFGNEAFEIKKANLPEFKLNFTDAIQYLKDNPEFNPFDQHTPAERMVIAAQQLLTKAVNKSNKNSVSYAAKKLSEEGQKQSVGERKDARNVSGAENKIKQILFKDDQAALNTLFNQSESYKNPRFSSVPGKGYKGSILEGPEKPNAPNRYIILDIWDKGKMRETQETIPYYTAQEKRNASTKILGLSNEALVGTKDVVNPDAYFAAIQKDPIFNTKMDLNKIYIAPDGEKYSIFDLFEGGYSEAEIEKYIKEGGLEEDK